MTISEALLESKQNGEAYVRMSGSCWIRYIGNGATYKLTTDDLIADDWVAIKDMGEKAV